MLGNSVSHKRGSLGNPPLDDHLATVTTPRPDARSDSRGMLRGGSLMAPLTHSSPATAPHRAGPPPSSSAQPRRHRRGPAIAASSAAGSPAPAPRAAPRSVRGVRRGAPALRCLRGRGRSAAGARPGGSGSALKAGPRMRQLRAGCAVCEPGRGAEEGAGGGDEHPPGRGSAWLSGLRAGEREALRQQYRPSTCGSGFLLLAGFF